MQKTRPCFTQEEKLTVRKWNDIKRICKYQNFKFYDIISDFCDNTCVWKALTWKQIIICRVHMAGRVFLAVFLCLAAIMEDQIKVEGWELEALEESLVCYKPTREICGVGTVTAVSRPLQKGEMIIYTRNEKAMMCVQTKIFILSWYLCQTFGGVDSKYRNTAVVFTPFGRCLRVNWESSNTARKEKRKKPKEKRSTRKKIRYDHAAPQVWKKH